MHRIARMCVRTAMTLTLFSARALADDGEPSSPSPAPSPDEAEPTPTPAADDEDDAAPAAAASSSKPAAPPGPNEVKVNGMKKAEPTAPRDSLAGNDIRRMPGAFGDAFRAIESMPGVTPIASGLPYFFVRGAPPGNTGFFIDGVRVPGLFHLGIGPAVMYPALIDKVDLYKSAYPVSYGRFAGGILSAELSKPATRPRADWTLRLFDAGALVETPFGPKDESGNQRGTALVSGRYGYPALLLTAFVPDVALAYWDYQSRATYKLTDRDTLSVFSFGSYDSVSARRDEQDVEDKSLHEVLNIQFHRVDLRWDHRLSATGSMRTAVTFGYDRTSSETFAARSFLAGARVQARERISKTVQVRAGADALMQSYDFGVPHAGGNDDIEIDVNADGRLQKDVNLGAWIDAPIELAPRAHLTPGIRGDIFTSRGIGSARAVPAVDPRLTSRIGIGPIYHLAAVGIAHQPSTLPLPIPALTFAQLRKGLQTGYQLSQGLEIPLPLEFTGIATTYLHSYTGLVDLASPCDDDRPRCAKSLTGGRSIGVEMMLKRNLGNRVSGWVAYTLSRSTRDAWDPETRHQTNVVTQFDRTHVFNAVVSVDLGRGWRVGGRYAGYTGIPYSTISPVLLPNARTPSFHRVDARIEKRWMFKEQRSIAFTAEMFNMLLMKEAIGITCSGYDGCKPDDIGPIVIPSLGCEGTL
jgi:hypothetical protein